MTRKEFFSHIYRAADSDDLTNVFTIPDRRTEQFPTDDIDSMLAYCDERRSEQNVFFCVQPMGRITTGRGTSKDAKRVVAMIADIDFGVDPNGKKKRFVDQSTAMDFVCTQTGLTPSAVVCSGNGLHGYWFLNEPIEIENTLARIEAQTFCKRWSQAVQSRAAALGAAVDSVFDLARVLRVPGTINLKSDEPKPVEIISDWLPKFYDAEHFESLFVDDVVAENREPIAATGERWDRDASVDYALVEQAFELDAKFEATWKMQRRDLKDGSFSGYELSLANHAVAHGWPDEIISNLIVAFRRKHGGDLNKVTRVDYLQRTIRAARSTHRVTEANEAVDRIVNDAPTDDNDAGDAGADLARRTIGSLLGIDVARFVQHGTERPQYYLILADGRDIPLGTVRDVRNQDKFQDAMFIHCHSQFINMPRPRWVNFCNLLLQIVEIEIDESDGRANKFADWIISYMAGKTIYSVDDVYIGIAHRSPFWYRDRDGGRNLHIPVVMFKEHVNAISIDRQSGAEFSAVMRTGGAMKRTRSARSNDGIVVSCSCWRLNQWPIEQAFEAAREAGDIVNRDVSLFGRVNDGAQAETDSIENDS